MVLERHLYFIMNTTKLDTWQDVGSYIADFEVNANLLNNLSRISDNVDIRDFVSKGQLASKLWASTLFNKHIHNANVAVCGGWYGLLPAILLHKNHEKRNKFTSIDIDSTCAPVANSFNAEHYFKGEFYADTADMYEVSYHDYDVIVNTSCEHIDDLSAWIRLVPPGKRLILQSNDFFSCDQHVNCVNNLDEFVAQCKGTDVIESQILSTPNYTRFMILCSTN